MSHSSLQPPVPFADFEFSFDPSFSNLFPSSPPSSSADLFSTAETTDLLGFLDNFGDYTSNLNAASSSLSQARSGPSESSSTTPSTFSIDPLPTTARAKPLLSSPQKRLNHIMSEQKRRNAIRDGYAQLIALLAPAGSASTIGMPTRGRPKGSGSRGKGQSKGKSGVLFRAVEYCRWLEEGRDRLRDEVTRLEMAVSQS